MDPALELGDAAVIDSLWYHHISHFCGHLYSAALNARLHLPISETVPHLCTVISPCFLSPSPNCFPCPIIFQFLTILTSPWIFYLSPVFYFHCLHVSQVLIPVYLIHCHGLLIDFPACRITPFSFILSTACRLIFQKHKLEFMTYLFKIKH